MKYRMLWVLAFSITGACTINSVSQEDGLESQPVAYTNSLQAEPVRVSRSVPKDAVVVSDIEAGYCHKTLGDRADAESAVMTSLQADAQLMGADGIANVEMNTELATAFLDTCWKQVTATGTAYKLAP